MKLPRRASERDESKKRIRRRQTLVTYSAHLVQARYIHYLRRLDPRKADWLTFKWTWRTTRSPSSDSFYFSSYFISFWLILFYWLYFYSDGNRRADWHNQIWRKNGIPRRFCLGNRRTYPKRTAESWRMDLRKRYWKVFGKVNQCLYLSISLSGANYTRLWKDRVKDIQENLQDKNLIVTVGLVSLPSFTITLRYYIFISYHVYISGVTIHNVERRTGSVLRERSLWRFLYRYCGWNFSNFEIQLYYQVRRPTWEKVRRCNSPSKLKLSGRSQMENGVEKIQTPENGTGWFASF